MAEYEQIMKALRNADAAGDVAAAKRLAAMAKAARTPAVEAAPAPVEATPQAVEPAPEPAKTATPFRTRNHSNAAAPVVAADGTEMVLNPATGQMTSRELMAGNIRPGQGQSFLAGVSQGVTLGAGDEIYGAIAGPFQREKARATVDAARRDNPITTGAGELAGAASIPIPGAAPASGLKQAAITGAKVGAATGAAYSFNSADGGIVERSLAGLEGAIGGALIGATIPAVVNVGTKAFRRVFKSSVDRPSIESLRTVKNVAYDAVDKAGQTFDQAEMTALANTVKQELANSNYVPGVDTQTDGVVKLLNAKSASSLTLGQLDKLRQNFFSRYNTAKNETGILDAIDAIDTMILSRQSASDLMDAARLANSRYKKAEVLDLAFQKARDQTSSTGSGGNILNKYRQAVTSIINNPKQAKWFSADEIDTMRNFIQGSTGQNAMRLMGKLSPGGNGLMTALNLGAVAVDPAALAVTALAGGAKAISDNATERGAQGLIAKVAGATQRAADPIRYPANALAGPLQEYLPTPR